MVGARSLWPISLPRPLGSPLWQPMSALSSAAPPGGIARPLHRNPLLPAILGDWADPLPPQELRTQGLGAFPSGVELLKCRALLLEDVMGWGRSKAGGRPELRSCQSPRVTVAPSRVHRSLAYFFPGDSQPLTLLLENCITVGFLQPLSDNSSVP